VGDGRDAGPEDREPEDRGGEGGASQAGTAASGGGDDVPAEAERLRGCVLSAHLDGVVSSGSADYLASAVDAAERERCQAVLVTIDTPGGTLGATRTIVKRFLGARVAVLTYVAPSGARAGSAGVFITMAGHVAAMSPGTNIGAAHPVVGMGQDPEESGGKHMAAKVENDTAAFARSIAEERGRNADWAERAVRESVSVTAKEAKKKGVVDLLADSEGELLDAVDGRVVRVDGSPVRLTTGRAELRRHQMTIRQRAMTLLGDPTLSYILFMIGVLGIMMEVYNPGLIVPGAVGALALLLAGIGMNALPVNLGAVILLAVGMALFVAEIHIASFGLLTLGGVACLALGSALLIDKSDPDFFADASVRISWTAIAPLVLLVGGATGGFGWQAARLRKRQNRTGREGMIGAIGRARSEVGPAGGEVRVFGETWRATSDRPIEPDARVRICGVQGLELRVEPCPEEGRAGARAGTGDNP
jgi:membrane-bound serine protease (ClpP class)